MFKPTCPIDKQVVLHATQAGETFPETFTETFPGRVVGKVVVGQNGRKPFPGRPFQGILLPGPQPLIGINYH